MTEELRGIRTEHLSIGYDRELIRDICLEALPGRIVTLIGPNGSGKSTLLKTLTGELAAKSGLVYLDGKDRNLLSANETAKRLSMVMTHRVRPEWMTCREVIELGRYPYTGRLGILSARDKEIVRKAITWADAEEIADSRYQQISDGQRQRVLLASAICRQPQILILDEPTSYLDIRYKLDILGRIRTLAREQNMAVLMSLHELESARLISDFVVALGEGKVLKMGSPGEVFREAFIRKLYHIEGMDTALLGEAPWFPADAAGREGSAEMADAAGSMAAASPIGPARRCKVIMIQGTMSNAGKSVIAAGLCRIFHQDGYRVAPFKSQNMALNSCVTEEGLEMGRAQVMQAECACTAPRVCMNPILLKPTDDRASQVIVNGKVAGTMQAAEYFRCKKEFLPEILSAFEQLSEENDIIVAEGAGSPVEMNLKEDDIVNMGLAELLDAPVLLVGDIDRGGIFPQLLGTLDLLTPEERNRVKGLIVNKFRGDAALFEGGLRILEERGRTDVIGLVPWLDVHLDDEDSLSHRFRSSAPSEIDLAVIRFPHISNFTDFDTFEQLPEVSVRYISSPEELFSPDLILLPGSKNTIGDLRWLKECGLAEVVRKKGREGTAVLGICGGYQMLGRCVSDPEHTECGGWEEGLGLLPAETVLDRCKVTSVFHGRVEEATGILGKLSGKSIEGYEIHMGRTAVDEGAHMFTSGGSGCCSGNVYGTYIHGLFDKKDFLEALVCALSEAKGARIRTEQLMDYAAFKETQYDLLADHLRRHLNMEKIYQIMGIEQ